MSKRGHGIGGVALDKFWGTHVWEAIPWDLGFNRAAKVADDIFRYPFDGRSFLLVKLHHPSQGYPAEASHRILVAAGAAAECG